MLSAIMTVLGKYSNWLNYRSITQEIINDWLYVFGWPTPELSVNTTINRYISREWSSSNVVYLWNGMYIMRKYYNEIDRAKEKPVEIIEGKDELEDNQSTIAIESENISNINNNDLDFSVINNELNNNTSTTQEVSKSWWNISGFVGKWWEFAVCTELLFRQFNATIMPVDSWADILATKNNELFNIQVKTSHLWQDSVYRFFIKNSSFQRYNTTNMYYVFVIIGADKNRDYVIIPSFNIHWMIWANQITKWQQWYAVWIRYQNNNKISLTNGVDLTHYLNKWSWIDRRAQ